MFYDDNGFIQKYSQLIVQLWTDELDTTEFQAAPRHYLEAVGLKLPPESEIEVEIRPNSSASDLEAQLDLWQQGVQTNHYKLIVPERPSQFDPNDLVLTETHLDMVVGGTSSSATIGLFCCCCSTYS